jgi:transcription initiation factor IIF auxiliary subunit
MAMAMARPNSVPLMHVKAPYDPVKAHEYYLRVRELKGRGKGSQGFTVRSNGKETRLSQQQLVEQQAYAAKRVNDIKNRLADLTSQLRKAMSEARRKKAKSDHEASKPKTAAEKSKAARESKKYQKKHQGELATKKKQADAKKSKTKTKADPVAELEAKIEKVKGSLRAAVAIQRSLASATKNT